ncbi:restriction endonuclease subunit S [candidate division WOR-3 bacterium]|nr:restriction endonuclease subunit S [candidate division WOR-3 bacterium]
MKYSIVNYQDIDELSFRFDAEFYHPEYLSNQLIIKKYENGHIKFGKIIKYISGGATPLGANYPETGIPFLRVQNIMNNYFNDDDIVYITEADHDLLKRSKLKENDVLLTITGISYGKSAVVIKKYEGANINQHSVKIELDTSRFLPYFISTFLNSSYGKKQSDKFIVGITRPALDYKRIREYLIPLLSLDFQRLIEKIGIKSHNTIDHANYLYSQAEHILLSELELLN